MSDETFIVVVASAICQPGSECKISYSWDRKTFNTRKSAIAHGFTLGCSDDFNIAIIRDGSVSTLWWMDELIPESKETLHDISREIFL